jgi:geranylgeranyl reductase family protein
MGQRIPREADVIVVGAGTAGCSAAIPAARAGHTVLIIEKSAAADVGSKVCGNGISVEGLRGVARYVPPPDGTEVAARVEGGNIHILEDGPGTHISVSGLIINRALFGQRLLSDALTAGASLVDRTTCLGWSDRVSGRIRVRSEGGEESEVTARVVVDASGFRSVLTRSGGPTRPDEPLRSEVGVGYREILVLSEPLEESTGGFIVLSPPGAERGYAWAFPMGGSLANVGIGRTLDNHEGSLRGAYDAFVASRPELRKAQTVSAGAGMLPLRRPLDSMVGDGFVSVGDSACHASPVHGGGIASSIIAGVMAGEQAVEAIEEGDVSASALWGYAVRFMGEVGATYAAHEVVRGLVYSLSREDLAFLASEYIKADALVEAVAGGNLLPSLVGGARRLASLARRPRLIASVVAASRSMAAVRQHYLDYPRTPERLASWAGKAEYLRRSIRR